MNVTITGADGLLGSNIVRQLLESGHTVRAFLQAGKESPTLEGLAIERVHGDILDAAGVRKAFEGSDAVIHAAANTGIWPSRSPLIRRINIEGTANAVEAVLAAGIGRLVYIGTANSFTPGTKEAPGDETTGYSCGTYGLDYMDSKYEAQGLVLSAVRERGLPALIINPSFMIGPYDSTPSSGTMLLRLYQGKIFGYTPGGRCFTPVKDVAAAVVNALTMGRTGECYIAGGRNLDYNEFFTLAAGVMGVSPPKRKVSRALVLPVGLIQSATAKLTGKPPLLSYTAARISFDGHYYNPSKARKELAMPSSSLEEAVDESFSWLKDHGYLENVK